MATMHVGPFVLEDDDVAVRARILNVGLMPKLLEAKAQAEDEGYRTVVVVFNDKTYTEAFIWFFNQKNNDNGLASFTWNHAGDRNDGDREEYSALLNRIIGADQKLYEDSDDNDN